MIYVHWLSNNKLIASVFPSIASDKLSLKDQITFFTSIHNFLKNGFTLDEAMDFYVVVHPKLKDKIKRIKQNLLEGQSFAESIEKFVNFRTYCQLKIAEFHGNLLNALNNVSQFLKLKQNQRSKLFGLMIYPAFLILLLGGIVTGIEVLVAPQIQNGESSNHGSFIWAAIILIPVGILCYGLWKYCREQSRAWQLNLLLKIPLAGNVCRSYFAYYFSSNLALMMGCGMDLKQIVKFMGSFKTSSLIQSLSLDLKDSINHGNKLSQLRKKYHFLPKDMMMLLETGDTTHVLAQKLNAYAKVKFKAMIKQSSRMISMIQPVMFLIIGLFIAGAYLSMLLPMYQSIKGVY